MAIKKCANRESLNYLINKVILCQDYLYLNKRKEVVIAMTSYIYKITNIINRKVYIGKTINPDKRWKSHIRDSKKYKDRYLYRAMNKYGIDNFNFEVIHKDIEDSDIDRMEIYYIQKYKSKNPNGYNMTDGGEGSTGRPMKESTKIKLIKANKGRKISEETKKKMSYNMKKRYENKEERIKMSMKLKGVSKNNGGKLKEYWKSFTKEEVEEKMKPLIEARKVGVLMLDLETEGVIMGFDSVRGASKWIKENTSYEKAGHQNIGKACKGKINYVYGYKWKYK